MARQFQGYVDALSIVHAAGWLRDLGDPAARFEVEAVVPRRFGKTVLGRAVANAVSPVLQELGIGDGDYAFDLRFDRPVAEAELKRVFLRPAGTSFRLERAPALITRFPLIPEMDVQLHDGPTQMAPEIFSALLLLAPYAATGAIRIPGLDGPVLDYLARIPPGGMPAFSVAAELGRRVPPIVFERIAKSGLARIWAGVPGFAPEIFARAGRAAQFAFFMEQFAALNDAVARASAFYTVPELCYAVALDDGNLAAWPAILARLAGEGRAARIRAIAPDVSAAQFEALQSSASAYPQIEIAVARAALPAWRLDCRGELFVPDRGSLGRIQDMRNPADTIAAKIWTRG